MSLESLHIVSDGNSCRDSQTNIRTSSRNTAEKELEGIKEPEESGTPQEHGIQNELSSESTYRDCMGLS